MSYSPTLFITAVFYLLMIIADWNIGLNFSFIEKAALFEDSIPGHKAVFFAERLPDELKNPSSQG